MVMMIEFMMLMMMRIMRMRMMRMRMLIRTIKEEGKGEEVEEPVSSRDTIQRRSLEAQVDPPAV